MIEKLPFEITQGEYEGKKFDIKKHTSPFDMQVKINELVDAVNELHAEAENNARIRANHKHKIEEFQAKDEEIAELKSIWHNADKTPRQESRVLWKSGNVVCGGRFDTYYKCFCGPASQFVGLKKVSRWAYLDDLLACEKELADTKKKLEQSEICCTEWEKQALDYKAENIGLQSKLDIAVDALKTIKRYLCEMPAPDGATVLRMTCESATTVKKALEQINQKEQQ